ncbi:MAG: FG-GAP-like repeat-containing protein [Pyrinomonadaceae bacterium]
MKTKKNIFHRIFIAARFILLISICVSPVKAAGEVDTSFNPILVKAPVGQLYQSIIQPDGKIIVTGLFNVVGSSAKTNIARLNADGTLDTSFTAPLIVPEVGGLPVRDIALQSDGKIVFTGNFFGVGDIPRRGIARLNADGSPDIAFNTNPALNDFASVSEVEIAPDDKIYVRGIINYDGAIFNALKRLNNDGSIDNQIFPFSGSIRMLPDGKLAVFTQTNLRRLNTDFTFDNTFTTVQAFNGFILDLIVQADGRIVIAGFFLQVNDASRKFLARINTDGGVDTNYHANAFGPNNSITKLVLMPGGKILAGGPFIEFNHVSKIGLALLNTNGTLDESFTMGGKTPSEAIKDVDVQADGKIVLTLLLSPASGAGFSRVIRLNADGSLDNSFAGVVLGDFAKADKTLVLPDDKFFVGGDFTYANGQNYKYLVKFNADGTLDTSFRQTVFDYRITAFDFFADGKIVAGSQYGAGVRRLNPDGSPDVTYQNVSSALDIKTLPDGKVLIAQTDGSLTRHNNDGSLDPAFTVSAIGNVRKIVLQADGKILIGGDFTEINNISRDRIARLNANGTVDASFGPIGGANDTVYDIALQPDGKIIVGGTFTSVNFANRSYLARLNLDGSLDTSFNPAVNNFVYAVKLQPDGKVLIGGEFTLIENIPQSKYARLNSNGSLNSFNTSTGANAAVKDIELQTTGKIIMVGDFLKINGALAPGIVRLLNYSNVPFDFDGDSKTDISIFRPSAGEWWYSRSSDGGNYAAQFGNSADKLVPGDYTGDGRADIAVFRPVSGEWFILRSEDGSYYSYPFGTSGDVPTVGDFDGDGKADSAVFRPSDTNWYIRRSSDSGFTIEQFGANGDIPAVADYDGDGKSDIAIWRASAGQWWIQRSSNASVEAFTFGNSTDKPVQGDYTGDGKADVAIWRPSSGEWFILRSNDFSYYSFPFGTNGDVPAPGDYDGDGRFDATVFRPSQSTWYVQRSTAGTLIQSFGQIGDVPVPNAFVP